VDYRSETPSGLYGRLKKPQFMASKDLFAEQLEDLVFIGYVVALMTTLTLAFLLIAVAAIIVLTYV